MHCPGTAPPIPGVPKPWTPSLPSGPPCPGGSIGSLEHAVLRIFWPREGVLLFPVASYHPLPFLLAILRNSGELQEACPGHCLVSSSSEPPAPRKHANHLLSKLEKTFRATQPKVSRGEGHVGAQSHCVSITAVQHTGGQWQGQGPPECHTWPPCSLGDTASPPEHVP